MDTVMESPEQARRDVVRQRQHDRKRGVSFRLLEVRYHALLDAAAACERRENGAVFAERQALVDLASCAELMAAQRQAPNHPV
jgi:hypothetical protein